MRYRRICGQSPQDPFRFSLHSGIPFEVIQICLGLESVVLVADLYREAAATRWRGRNRRGGFHAGQQVWLEDLVQRDTISLGSVADPFLHAVQVALVLGRCHFLTQPGKPLQLVQGHLGAALLQLLQVALGTIKQGLACCRSVEFRLPDHRQGIDHLLESHQHSLVTGRSIPTLGSSQTGLHDLYLTIEFRGWLAGRRPVPGQVLGCSNPLAFCQRGKLRYLTPWGFRPWGVYRFAGVWIDRTKYLLTLHGFGLLEVGPGLFLLQLVHGLWSLALLLGPARQEVGFERFLFEPHGLRVGYEVSGYIVAGAGIGIGTRATADKRIEDRIGPLAGRLQGAGLGLRVCCLRWRLRTHTNDLLGLLQG